MPTLPSADFCGAVREPRGSLSPEPQDTPQISRGKFDRLPRTTAGSTPRTFDGFGLRDHLPARPAQNASYPVLVHRLARLLHASFRPHLAVTPLRFANPSPPSGWVGDFHPQAVEHARHTKKGGWTFAIPPETSQRAYFAWQLKQRLLWVSATQVNLRPVFFVLCTSWQDAHSIFPPKSRSFTVNP